MSRVLVTGATGFIGRGALEPLLRAGMEVHAVTSRAVPSDAPLAVQWHVADLLTPGSERDLAALAPTHLLHLAWYAEPGRFWRAASNLDWVAASLRLLRAFAEAGGQRVVMAGSCAEYEWTDDTVCAENVTPTRPATLYGAAKHGLHTIASAYTADAGLSMAWGRVFFVFGPHEDPARLAGSVASALVAGEPALCSHGRQIRDFMYAPELAASFVALLRSDVTGPVNLASGQPVRIRDLIASLAEAAGRPDLVRLGARPGGPEPARLTADVTRLRDEVGWSGSLSLEEAARRTVTWWRKQAS